MMYNIVIRDKDTKNIFFEKEGVLLKGDFLEDTNILIYLYKIETYIVPDNIYDNYIVSINETKHTNIDIYKGCRSSCWGKLLESFFSFLNGAL